MCEIFLSYRGADSNFAAAHLYEKLCKRFGDENVFLADQSIPPGRPFPPVLWSNLRRSSVVLVLIGSDWLTASRDGTRLLDDPNDYVRREVAEALELDLYVVPVLLADTPMPTEDQLPADIAGLATRQYRRLRARTSKYDVPRLVDELAELLGHPAPAAPLAASAGVKSSYRLHNGVHPRRREGGR